MRAGGRAWVAIVAAAILLVAAAPARAASIKGTITDAITHKPVGDVEACAYEALPNQFEAEPGRCEGLEAEPEVPGEYVIGGIPEGSYKVAFVPKAESKYALQFYDDVGSWAEAKVVAVLPSSVTPGIDAALDEVQPSEPTQPEGDAQSGGDVTETAPPPPEVAPILAVVPKPEPRLLHCKKGFRKTKVKGKLRCVKVHHPKHRRPAHRA